MSDERELRWTEKLDHAADAAGGVARRINYLLNNYAAVFGTNTPMFVSLDKMTTELFEAAKLVREALNESTTEVVRQADADDFPDPEWLRSVGGEPDDEADDEAEPGSGNEPPWLFTYPDLNIALTLTCHSECWTAELGGGDFSSGNWPHDIRTRDQVRRLLAALGLG